jgi:hypothetical protein
MRGRSIRGQIAIGPSRIDGKRFSEFVGDDE